jgi:hypothetical protein
MKRRLFVALLAAAHAVPSLAATAPVQLEVFKSPSCGCCGAWVEHMKAAGFAVKIVEVDDTAEARRRAGLPEKFGSCHTGIVGGYVVEGHVPAADVRRLLARRPAAIGLAVPGMPVGSPGMEHGGRRDPHDVLLVDKSGRASVFSHYPKS